MKIGETKPIETVENNTDITLLWAEFGKLYGKREIVIRELQNIDEQLDEIRRKISGAKK